MSHYGWPKGCEHPYEYIRTSCGGTGPYHYCTVCKQYVTSWVKTPGMRKGSAIK